VAEVFFATFLYYQLSYWPTLHRLHQHSTE